MEVILLKNIKNLSIPSLNFTFNTFNDDLDYSDPLNPIDYNKIYQIFPLNTSLALTFDTKDESILIQNNEVNISNFSWEIVSLDESFMGHCILRNLENRRCIVALNNGSISLKYYNESSNFLWKIRCTDNGYSFLNKKFNTYLTFQNNKPLTKLLHKGPTNSLKQQFSIIKPPKKEASL